MMNSHTIMAGFKRRSKCFGRNLRNQSETEWFKDVWYPVLSGGTALWMCTILWVKRWCRYTIFGDRCFQNVCIKWVTNDFFTSKTRQMSMRIINLLARGNYCYKSQNLQSFPSLWEGYGHLVICISYGLSKKWLGFFFFNCFEFYTVK